MRLSATLIGLVLVIAGCPTRDQLLTNGTDAGSSVSITSPVSPTYTNGTVTIVVAVQGSANAPITILAGATTIATLTPPQSSFQWDTGSMAEGSYDVTAQISVGGQTVTSMPLTIVVDRTAPAIKSLTPPSGASDVVLAAPAVITFSEPVIASGITSSFVSLQAAAATLPTSLALSADDTTVTVTLSSDSGLTLPATLTAVFSTAGITDRAGNPLIAPAAPWTWMVPDWIKLAPFPSNAAPALAVGPDLRPVIAYLQCIGGNSNGCQLTLHVAVNDGQAWNDLGTPAPGAGVGFSLAVDGQSHPIVSWAGNDGAGVPIVSVASWNGTAWAPPLPTIYDGVGTGTTINTTALKLDASGNPVVGWRHTVSSTASDVYVAHWTGSAWDASFGQVGLGDVQSFDLVLDDQGNPTVGFINSIQSGAATWNGSAWATSPSVGSSTPFVALDSAQNPLMLQTGAAWIVEHLTGGTWLPAVSSPLPASSTSYAPHLVTDIDDLPVVGWIDPSVAPPELGLARWIGTKWDARAGLFNGGSAPDGSPPAVAVDARGSIWIAWFEGTEVNAWMSNY